MLDETLSAEAGEESSADGPSAEQADVERSLEHVDSLERFEPELLLELSPEPSPDTRGSVLEEYWTQPSRHEEDPVQQVGVHGKLCGAGMPGVLCSGGHA